MVGLIVKGDTSAFFVGPDPGPKEALAVVNRLRMGNSRSLATKLDALAIEVGRRPKPLLRSSLDWAYVFLTLTDGDIRRLEPGPFDAELSGVVSAVEAERASD